MRIGFCENCKIETTISFIFIQINNSEFDACVCSDCSNNLKNYSNNLKIESKILLQDSDDNFCKITEEKDFHKLFPKSTNHFQILQKFIF